MKKPKLNVRLLKRIVKHLKAEPKRYNQAQWAEHVVGEDAPACGTQGCIAGWAVFLSVPKRNWLRWITKNESGNYRDPSSFTGIAKRAKKLLGLTSDEASELFAPSNQTYSTGPNGVKSAERKITALIADRKQFGENYYEHS